MRCVVCVCGVSVCQKGFPFSQLLTWILILCRDLYSSGAVLLKAGGMHVVGAVCAVCDACVCVWCVWSVWSVCVCVVCVLCMVCVVCVYVCGVCDV